MTTTTRVILIAIGLAVVLSVVVAAQMMGEGQHMTDSTMHQGQGDMMSMVHDLTEHSQMMSGEFDRMQDHFQTMMQMDDMKKLKSEMQQHQKMMQEMHTYMNKQQQLCEGMMTMMHSGQGSEMMHMDDSAEHGHMHR